jgi:hypothetical protein
MDLDVLLVDYLLDTSAVWRLGWRYELVVRVRGIVSGWDGANLVSGMLRGWVEMNLDDNVEERSDRRLRVRGIVSGWDRANLVFGVLSGWVEMNLDDDVEERSDRRLKKSGQGLRESGRSQRNDRSQRNNHRRVDDRHQMNHHSRGMVVFLSALESKNENNDPSDAPDNKKGLDRIVDHELVSTHSHAYLKKHDIIQD